MLFTKMHGLGNDYIFINGFEENVERPEELARAMSDRHTGVGGDGIVLILPSATADFRMRIFNLDGSEAENCGNAIRCVAKYVYEQGLTDQKQFHIETGAGNLLQKLHISEGQVTAVTVSMGVPRLERSEIPMAGPAGRVLNEPLEVDGITYKVTCLSMGNPHCVVYVDDVEAVPLAQLGPKFEHHPAFPRRTNTEFVQVLGRDDIRLRVWERGSGPTLACGTGMTAAAVASILNGYTDHRVCVHVKLGHLVIEWPGEGQEAFMTGPAEEVFTGEWPEG